MSTPIERAEALIAFADGLEEAGQVDTARRARDVARDVLDLENRLASAESAAQTARERLTAYTAYHQAHCFRPDGTARTDPPLAPDAAEDEPGITAPAA